MSIASMDLREIDDGANSAAATTGLDESRSVAADRDKARDSADVNMPIVTAQELFEVQEGGSEWRFIALPYIDYQRLEYCLCLLEHVISSENPAHAMQANANQIAAALAMIETIPDVRADGGNRITQNLGKLVANEALRSDVIAFLTATEHAPENIGRKFMLYKESLLAQRLVACRDSFLQSLESLSQEIKDGLDKAIKNARSTLQDVAASQSDFGSLDGIMLWKAPRCRADDELSEYTSAVVDSVGKLGIAASISPELRIIPKEAEADDHAKIEPQAGEGPDSSHSSFQGTTMHRGSLRSVTTIAAAIGATAIAIAAVAFMAGKSGKGDDHSPSNVPPAGIPSAPAQPSNTPLTPASAPVEMPLVPTASASAVPAPSASVHQKPRVLGPLPKKGPQPLFDFNKR